MTKIVSTENSEHYTWGGVSDGWLLLQSRGLGVIQERVPPGGAEVKHLHTQAHQFFFVLAGEAVMEIGAKRFILGPNQGLSVPPGVAHRLLNEGKQDLSFLVISSPMSHGDRIPVD